MKDIKSLYLAAKSTGRQQDINMYMECVQDFLENHPNDYVSNLEYIISSNVGLSTLNEFVEKHGISIASYDQIMTCLEDGVKKCRYQAMDNTLYQEAIKMMESFKQKYSNCFIMFEAFQDKMSGRYIEAYYKNFPILRNPKGNINISGMLSRYGESCIPDMLIYTNQFGNPNVVLNFLESHPVFNTPTFYQWILESMNDINNSSSSNDVEGAFNMLSKSRDQAIQARETYGKNSQEYQKAQRTVKTSEGIYNNAIKEYKKSFKKDATPPEELPIPHRDPRDIESMPSQDRIRERSLEGIVESIQNRYTSLYRESVLTRNDNIIMEYSSEEIQAMEDLISFKEYQLTCLENTEEILKLQSQIYSIYEQLGNIIEEDIADSITPMLPQSNSGVINEGQWLSNTQNKKTGQMPDYIARNHDLSYGEEDNIGKKKHNSDSDEESTLDDFKRPSVNTDKTNKQVSPEPEVFPYNEPKADSTKPLTPEEKNAINNYYYYTYTNSNNTNTGSFNKHHKDDHSTHVSDDHSTGKRINSDDINSKNREFKKECDQESIGLGESINISFEDLMAIPINEMYQFHEDYDKELIEATAALVPGFISNTAARTDNPEKPGFLQRAKELIDRLLKFLLEMWDKIFPKTLWDFMQLEKKYRNSPNIQKRCKENDSIIPILQINIPGLQGMNVAIQDLVHFVNQGILPNHDAEYYKKINRPVKLMIYYGSYTNSDRVKGPDDLKFCLASSDGVFDVYQNPILNRLDRKNRLKIATYLSHDNLLIAMGVRVKNAKTGKMFTVDDIKALILAIRIQLGIARFKDSQEAHKTLMVALQALSNVTDHVSRTMNQAYRAAVEVLKNANNPPVRESAPWELDIFPRDEIFTEAVGDADKNKPTSDNPIQDTLIDIDRNLASTQQGLKKKVQGVQNIGRGIVKPFKRTAQWIDNLINQWKDANENEIKEKMADPHARKSLFSTIRKSIIRGSLYKAGILLNPVFIFLAITKKISNDKKEFRLRNEMIGELKMELEIIAKKIEDAERKGHDKEKYQLMRFKNELNKKLIRVGGSKGMAKMI